MSDKKRFFGSIDGPAPNPATWACKIGEIDRSKLPAGSDEPMRHAIEDAYFALTGEQANFVFSGWGAELDEPERAVVEDRLPEAPDPNRRFADRLRIEGDSTYRNTRVLFDGEQLHGVQEVTWAILGDKRASVTITFVGNPEIDVKP